MKKPLFLSLLVSFVAGGFFAAAPVFAQSPLSLNGSDLRLVPEYQNSEIKGYHLFIRKKPGLESVMLTESAKDPQGKKDSYALRAFEYNSINGDEIRYLNGKKLESVHARYSLIDSTAEKDSVFKEAFHIFIPLKVRYGYPWARSGEIEIKDGIFMNIRAFAKKYGDYSGGFFDNSFVLDLEGKGNAGGDRSGNPWKDRGEGFQNRTFGDKRNGFGGREGFGGQNGYDGRSDFDGRNGFGGRGSSDEEGEVEYLKKKLRESENARLLAEKKLSELEGSSEGSSDASGEKKNKDDDSQNETAKDELVVDFGMDGSAGNLKSSISSLSFVNDDGDSDSGLDGVSGGKNSEGASEKASGEDSGNSSKSGLSSSAEELGDEYYNKEAEKSYSDIAGSSVRSRGPDSIVSDIMGLVSEDEVDSSGDASGEAYGGAGISEGSEDVLAGGSVTIGSSDSVSLENESGSSDSASSVKDGFPGDGELKPGETIAMAKNTDEGTVDGINNSSANAVSEKEGSSSDGNTDGEGAGLSGSGDSGAAGTSDSSSNGSSGNSERDGAESSSGSSSSAASDNTSGGVSDSSSDSTSDGSSAKKEAASSDNTSDNTAGASSDENYNIQNPNENTSIGTTENSIERDYSEEAGKRFLEVSENLTYSKGPETIVQDVLKSFENESEGTSGVAAAGGKKKLDLVFVIDATGSMKDDIEQLRMDLVSQLAGFKASLDSFRVGLVFYRDYGDDFSYYGLPVKYYPFTDKLEEFSGYLNDITILGSEGGDIPEAVYEGLYAGLALYTWDKDAAKKIILIGDAEPHPKPRMTKRYTKQLVTKLSKDKGVKIDAIITPDGRIHGEN